MNNIIVLTITVVCILSLVYSAPQATKQYPLRLQPELDSVDVDAYLRNDRLFNFQLKCLFDEGPCDIVGKFLKPRVARALLGDCPVCTPIQKVKIEKVLEDLHTNRPEVYRKLFIKFIEQAGIKVDADKKVEPVKNDEIETHTDQHDQEALKLDGIPTEATAKKNND